jgi:hypothetical protein
MLIREMYSFYIPGDSRSQGLIILLFFAIGA